MGNLPESGVFDDEMHRVVTLIDGATPITFRSGVDVSLVDHMGGDSSVLSAARVSTVGARTLDLTPADHEAGLINYLMKNRHGTPFEHNSFMFCIKAPIFVHREFMTHRHVSKNTESGRYRRLSAEFYLPPPDRPLEQVGKPGAYSFALGTPEQHRRTVDAMQVMYSAAYMSYLRMLGDGVAREVARMVLPVGIYTSWYATCNSRALMHLLSLRTIRDGATYPSTPQREIEMVAEKMEALWAPLMPLTYRAFCQHGRVSP